MFLFSCQTERTFQLYNVIESLLIFVQTLESGDRHVTINLIKGWFSWQIHLYISIDIISKYKFVLLTEYHILTTIFKDKICPLHFYQLHWEMSKQELRQAVISFLWEVTPVEISKITLTYTHFHPVTSSTFVSYEVFLSASIGTTLFFAFKF